jgi:phosphoenolpyruvate-protein kinase (PTS system EI component)
MLKAAVSDAVETGISAQQTWTTTLSADGIAISVQINIANVGCSPIRRFFYRPEIASLRKVTPFLRTIARCAPVRRRRRSQDQDHPARRPVTIRTLDAGGDKPIAGSTPLGESDPFLGLRGVRLTLRRPDIFKTQLRALARAAAYGHVGIVAPPLNELSRVPSAALVISEFDVDFYSIGSSDLTQCIMAAGRDIGALAYLDSAVIPLIRQVVEHGRLHHRSVSLCSAAADQTILPKLRQAGLCSLSVAPGLVGATKTYPAKISIRTGL